jgi:hypothetical protein
MSVGLPFIHMYIVHRVKEERNIPHTIKRRKANWIGQIPVQTLQASHAKYTEVHQNLTQAAARCHIISQTYNYLQVIHKRLVRF